MKFSQLLVTCMLGLLVIISAVEPMDEPMDEPIDKPTGRKSSLNILL